MKKIYLTPLLFALAHNAAQSQNTTYPLVELVEDRSFVKLTAGLAQKDGRSAELIEHISSWMRDSAGKLSEFDKQRNDDKVKQYVKNCLKTSTTKSKTYQVDGYVKYMGYSFDDKEIKVEFSINNKMDTVILLPMSITSGWSDQIKAGGLLGSPTHGNLYLQGRWGPPTAALTNPYAGGTTSFSWRIPMAPDEAEKLSLAMGKERYPGLVTFKFTSVSFGDMQGKVRVNQDLVKFDSSAIPSRPKTSWSFDR